MSKRSQKRALLLGMVYSEEMVPKRGQEFRDRVRCEALDKQGVYEVFSLDDKHSTEHAREGRHCQANFADSRRMANSIRETWGEGMRFDTIILDYFFCPVGWAQVRWSEKFYRDSLPMLAERGILKPGGKVWLPYLQCVQDFIAANKKSLSGHYSIKLVKDAWRNPLYAATEAVEGQLLRTPDTLTNETQIKPFHEFSNTPFCVLERISKDAVESESECEASAGAHVVTPTKTSRKRGRPGPLSHQRALFNAQSVVSEDDDSVDGEGSPRRRRQVFRDLRKNAAAVV